MSLRRCRRFRQWERGPVSRARKVGFHLAGWIASEGGSSDGTLGPGEAKSTGGSLVCRITDPGLYWTVTGIMEGRYLIRFTL